MAAPAKKTPTTLKGLPSLEPSFVVGKYASGVTPAAAYQTIVSDLSGKIISENLQFSSLIEPRAVDRPGKNFSKNTRISTIYGTFKLPSVTTSESVIPDLSEVKREIQQLRADVVALAESVRVLTSVSASKSVPEADAWLFGNKEAVALAYRGLLEAAEGKGEVVSFAQFVEEE